MFQLWWNLYVGLIIICLNFSKNFILFVSRALALAAPTNLHICVEFIDWFANLQEKGKFLHVATIITMNMIDCVWSCKIDCSCSCIPGTRYMAPYHVPTSQWHWLTCNCSHGAWATCSQVFMQASGRISMKELWFCLFPSKKLCLLQCRVQFGFTGN